MKLTNDEHLNNHNSSVRCPPAPLSRLLATFSHLAVPNHDQHGRTVLSSHGESSANHSRLSTDHPSSSAKTQTSRYHSAWCYTSNLTVDYDGSLKNDHCWPNLQCAGQTSFAPKPGRTFSQSTWSKQLKVSRLTLWANTENPLAETVYGKRRLLQMGLVLSFRVFQSVLSGTILSHNITIEKSENSKPIDHIQEQE